MKAVPPATPMAFYRVGVAFLRCEDFLELSLVQQALLLRLRGYAAENGTLPVDLRRIVRRFKGKPKDVAALEPWFPMHPDGHGRVDPGLEIDRLRYADIREKRINAGKQRWKTRETETDSEDDGASPVPARGRPEQGQSETGLGSSKTEKQPSQHREAGASGEHVLDMEPDAATTYAAGTAGESTTGGEHMLSHAVHAVHAVHSVHAFHACPAVPSAPADAGASRAALQAGPRDSSAPMESPADAFGPAWRENLKRVGAGPREEFREPA